MNVSDQFNDVRAYKKEHFVKQSGARQFKWPLDETNTHKPEQNQQSIASQEKLDQPILNLEVTQMVQFLNETFDPHAESSRFWVLAGQT